MPWKPSTTLVAILLASISVLVSACAGLSLAPNGYGIYSPSEQGPDH
jgi:hypothetical protein